MARSAKYLSFFCFVEVVVRRSKNISELNCTGVVLVTQQRSDDELYQALLADANGLVAAGIEAVYAIGDAVAPRPISESVFDGHRLAREIDSDDPMRPLPYLRERIAL